MTGLEVPEVCPARKVITGAMACLDHVAWWAVLERWAFEAEQVSQARVAAPEHPAQQAPKDLVVIEVRLAPKENQDLLDLVVLLEHLARRALSVGAAIKALRVPKGTQDLQVTCGLGCDDHNPRRGADDVQVEWDEEVQWAPEASAAIQVCLCVLHALCFCMMVS